MNILNAFVTNFKTIKLTFDSGLFDIKKLSIKNGENFIDIVDYLVRQNTIELTLKDRINIKKECFILYEESLVKAFYFPLFSTAEFNALYYTDEALGAFYHQYYTTFRVWSPAATSISVLIYENGDPDIKENPKKFEMKEKNGLWETSIKGNLKGSFYTYLVKVYNQFNEAIDPYAKAVGINGLRGAIIDMEETSPRGFSKEYQPEIENLTDAIIYEASIRDISTHPNSGIRSKGKFAGLIESQPRSAHGLSTGLSHIKELGVTHIQFMPFFDFSYESVDEKDPGKYNWGYDPQNYNVPEGSFSLDPYDPLSRIIELKKMIQYIHQNGLCVNMDVVYNHVYKYENSCFEKIFPGYYFRYTMEGTLSNGSFCGNDTASEHLMMRKFITDSILFWAEEYHIDGFRFDLMGLHDVITMGLIRKKLNDLGRNIMMYGEGWNLNTALPDALEANQENASKMPHIAHFNDVVRDSVKGSVFSHQDRGFANGKENIEDTIRFCVSGCISYYPNQKSLFISPEQCVNYVSAHDNNTLWDKIEYTNRDDSPEDKKSMLKLATAIIMTCQGIPFLHSGDEFCRTKYGNDNSYNAPDTINRMDWDRKAEFLDIYTYYKGLIRLRKEHPAFRMISVEQIRKHLEFIYNSPRNTVVFLLKDYANKDTWKDILVIYNANRYSVSIPIPEGTWYLTTSRHIAGVDPIMQVRYNMMAEPISAHVLYKLY